VGYFKDMVSPVHSVHTFASVRTTEHIKGNWEDKEEG
jgi:hypothetical protein